MGRQRARLGAGARFTWMTNNQKDDSSENAPQKAGQGDAGVAIGHLGAWFGGDWGTLESFQGSEYYCGSVCLSQWEQVGGPDIFLFDFERPGSDVRTSKKRSGCI